MDIRLVNSLEKESCRSGQCNKGNRLVSSKSGSDGITSSFVAMRTDLFLLYNLTHAEGMESIRSKTISLSILVPQTSCFEQRKWKENNPDVTA